MNCSVAGARSRVRRYRHLLVQFLLNLLSLGDGGIVEFAQPGAIACGLVGEDYRRNLHLQANAIEGHDITKEHEDRIISIAGRSPIDIEHRLKPTGRIVTEISHRSARERRQSTSARKSLIAKILPQEFDGVFLVYFAHATLSDNCFGAMPAHD